MRTSGLRIAAFLYLIVFFIEFAKSQDIPANTFLVWQGFEHRWTYNHRLNRLGSYVQQIQDQEKKYVEGLVVNTAASGIGPDSASYDSYYSRVSSDLIVRPAHISLPIYASENQRSNFTIRKNVPLAAQANENLKPTTIINGFDLTSLGDADKIKALGISVMDIGISSEGEAEIEVSGFLEMACQSIECSPGNKVAYRLEIFLLVLGNVGELYALDSIDRSFQWGKSNGQVAFDQEVFTGFAKGSSSIAAFRSFELSLNKGHWLADFGFFLRPKEEEEDGIYQLSFRFAQSKRDMKKGSYSPRHSRFSFRRPGELSFTSKVLLIRLPSGNVRSLHHSGGFIWKGKNQSALNEQAVRTRKVEF